MNDKPVPVANESALGVYVLSFDAGDGAKGAVVWYEGIPGPMFEFTNADGWHWSRPVANPGRFGWPGPAAMAKASASTRLGHVKAFAQAFAATERDNTETGVTP